MTEVEKLKVLTGESDDNLLSLLISDATDYVLAYTNRTTLIPALAKPVRDLAVIAHNRLGTEGETGRSEGGESYSFDAAPKQIYDVLDQHRLLRVGGKSYENKEKPPVPVLPQDGDTEKE